MIIPEVQFSVPPLLPNFIGRLPEQLEIPQQQLRHIQVKHAAWKMLKHLKIEVCSLEKFKYLEIKRVVLCPDFYGSFLTDAFHHLTSDFFYVIITQQLQC